MFAEQMVYGNGSEITPTIRFIYSDGADLYLTFAHVTDTLVLHKTETPTFYGLEIIFFIRQRLKLLKRIPSGFIAIRLRYRKQ